MTSDEYLLSLCDEAQVYEVRWVEYQKPIDRFMGKVNGLLESSSGLLDSWRAR